MSNRIFLMEIAYRAAKRQLSRIKGSAPSIRKRVSDVCTRQMRSSELPNYGKTSELRFDRYKNVAKKIHISKKERSKRAVADVTDDITAREEREQRAARNDVWANYLDGIQQDAIDDVVQIAALLHHRSKSIAQIRYEAKQPKHLRGTYRALLALARLGCDANVTDTVCTQVAIALACKQYRNANRQRREAYEYKRTRERGQTIVDRHEKMWLDDIVGVISQRTSKPGAKRSRNVQICEMLSAGYAKGEICAKLDISADTLTRVLKSIQLAHYVDSCDDIPHTRGDELLPQTPIVDVSDETPIGFKPIACVSLTSTIDVPANKISTRAILCRLLDTNGNEMEDTSYHADTDILLASNIGSGIEYVSACNVNAKDIRTQALIAVYEVYGFPA